MELKNGKQLRQVRKRLGLTQAALAKMAGVSPGFIAGIERGVSGFALVAPSKNRILDALVRVEFARMQEAQATPKEKYDRLHVDFLEMKRKADWAFDQLEKREEEKRELNKRIADLMEILNLRTKKALTESDEKERIDALGLEQGPTVEEESLRAEIAQHSKQRVKKEER